MEGAWLIGNGKFTPLRGQVGETPPCPDALHKINDLVKIRRLKHLLGFPELAVVVAVVPPHFSPDWAWADVLKKPRPLMCQVGARYVQYIVGMEGRETPLLIREKWLKATGETAQFSFNEAQP